MQSGPTERARNVRMYFVFGSSFTALKIAVDFGLSSKMRPLSPSGAFTRAAPREMPSSEGDSFSVPLKFSLSSGSAQRIAAVAARRLKVISVFIIFPFCLCYVSFRVLISYHVCPSAIHFHPGITAVLTPELSKGFVLVMWA